MTTKSGLENNGTSKKDKPLQAAAKTVLCMKSGKSNGQTEKRRNRKSSVLLSLLLASLLTACSTPSTGTPPPVRPSPSPPTPTGPSCQTSQLTLAYDRSQAALSNRADQFSLQNTSTSTCTLLGYPQIQLLLADGHPTPTQATQATRGYLFQTALQVVALPAGAKAYFVIEWVAGTCAEYASTAGAFVQVSPPGATGLLTTSASAGADGGIDACGKIKVSPVSAKMVLY